MNRTDQKFESASGTWLKFPILILLMRLCFLSPSIYLGGCANMVAPTGGPRDSIPPQLIKAEPAWFTTGYNGDRLTFQFNEFVRIQNRGTIRMLPDPGKPPIIRDAINRIVVDFNAVPLDTSTTYTLYMGDAVVDFTEGNKLKEFKHVFSTGPTIDTGWISGRVSDASNAKPRPQARVALYDWVESGDSVVYKQKARYWTTTDDSGRFFLGYLPMRDFRLFVWADENKDEFYKAGEAFDFIDIPVRPIQSSYDSSLTCFLSLSIDRDEQSRIMDYVEKWPGWLGITFSARPTELNWIIEGGVTGDSITKLQYWKGDTAYVFMGEAYKNAELGQVVAVCKMIHRADTIIRRTIPIPEQAKATGTTVNELPLLKPINTGVPELCAGRSFLRYTGDVPLERIDTAAIIWADTTSGRVVQTGAMYIYVEGLLSFAIPEVLIPGRIYKFIIPRGSIFGGGGQVLDSVFQVFKVVSDSLVKNISVITSKKEKQLSEIAKWAQSGRTVEIVDASGYKCGVYRFTDAEQGGWDHGQPTLGLLPGTYSVTIYSDENKNTKHDSASWRLNRRAEHNHTAQWSLSPIDRRDLQIDLSELIWK